ncbi:MAG: sulfite exporter TauE/SafE family protein [Kofleriaceae bacterium]
MTDPASIALVAAAALGGGAVNAIAGGGSLITFPTLVAAGLAPVTAAITNTVAMCPGYLGGTLAQRHDLAGQASRATKILPIAAIGGVAGAWLLLATSARMFELVVPFLLLFAALLVAVSGRLRAWLRSRIPARHAESLAIVPVGLAAIYGGYFGAGMGVIVLAALGAVIDDTLTRINALKQTVSLVVNVSAAIVFLVWGPIDWTVTLVMAIGSLGGGWLGGALATRISQPLLRWTVVVIGTAVAGIYFVKLAM